MIPKKSNSKLILRCNKKKISKMMQYKFILKLNYYFELHLEILNLELFMNRLQANLFAAH